MKEEIVENRKNMNHEAIDSICVFLDHDMHFCG